MWTVVYIARNKIEVERLKKKLTREGLLIKIKLIGCNKDEDEGSYEILVPASEVNEAMEVINTN